jgi:hypothetical protein
LATATITRAYFEKFVVLKFNFGLINTNVLGDYYARYNVSDSSGNAADEVLRNVHIIDTTKPIITLNGENLLKIIKISNCF